MKAKCSLKHLIILFTALFSTHVLAVDFVPHVGADYKFWQVEPKTDGASNNFIHTFPDLTRAGSFYIGTRINKNWGVDIGYDHSSKKNKWRSFDTTDFIFDQASVIGDASQVDMRLTAWYLSGLYYWEFYPNFEAIFHLGLASLQPKSTIIYYPVNAAPVELRFKLESKASARFGLGLQYLFLGNFGVRALVTFDQTGRINFVGSNQNNAPFDINPYKSSTSYNLGFFAEFNTI